MPILRLPRIKHQMQDFPARLIIIMSNPVPDFSAVESVPNSTLVDNDSNQVNLKRKPTRPASIIRDSFERNKVLGKATYSHCKVVYALSTSTTILNNHLKFCLSNPNKVVDKKQKTLGLVYQKYEEGKDVEVKAELRIIKFDQDECRIALAKMIIIDELSFRFVENEGFKEFMYVSQPQFDIPSRTIISRDCLKLYTDEKSRLKLVFKVESLRVCFTTDTWTSIQNLNYMVVTSHYIDGNWNYQKKLCFCLIPSHKGETIGKFLENCLLEWGIERITYFVITTHASYHNYYILHFI